MLQFCRRAYPVSNRSDLLPENLLSDFRTLSILLKVIIVIEGKISGLRHSPQCPTLPASLVEHTCCLYAFAPIPSTERNSGIPSLIGSIAAPSPQTKSAYWGCLHQPCPTSDYLYFATCAPQRTF